MDRTIRELRSPSTRRPEPRESEDEGGELPWWWEFPNILVAHLGYAVQMMDFEGQSALFSFVCDSIDMAIEVCSVLLVVLRIVLELKLRRKLTKIAMADAVLGLICLGGILYEARIAANFKEFLEAETQAADVLRTFKCLRLLLLLLERKYYWKRLHDFIMIWQTLFGRC